MNSLRRGPTLIVAALTAAIVLTTAAASEARTPIRDCGDIEGGGAYAITARTPVRHGSFASSTAPEQLRQRSDARERAVR